MKTIDISNKHKRNYVAYCKTFIGQDKIVVFDTIQKFDKWLGRQFNILTVEVCNQSDTLICSYELAIAHAVKKVYNITKDIYVSALLCYALRGRLKCQRRKNLKSFLRKIRLNLLKSLRSLMNIMIL